MKNDNFASIGQRFIAFFVDAIILNILFFFVSLAMFDGNSVTLGVFLGFSFNTPLERVTSLIFWLYFVLFTFFWGATLGKKFMGIKVVDVSTSNKPDFIKVIVREVAGKFISAIVIGLGFIWILFDKKKQGWHDKMANTFVVKSR